MFTLSSNRGSISFGFRNIDDTIFSASRTLWPLLVAKRPRLPMHGVSYLCLIATTALKRIVLDRYMGQTDAVTDGQADLHQLRLVPPLW